MQICFTPGSSVFVGVIDLGQNAAPRKVSVSMSDRRGSVLISWSPVWLENLSITGYNVKYCHFTECVTLKKILTLNTTVHALCPETEYNFTVASRNGNNIGNWSEPLLYKLLCMTADNICI